MPNAVIDTLEVKIKANADAATKSLEGLAKALTSVRSALSGASKNQATQRLSKSINDLNASIQNLNSDSIKKLNDMASSIHKYASALERMRGLDAGTMAKDLGKVDAALAKVNARKAKEEKEKPMDLKKAGVFSSVALSESLLKSGVFRKIIDAQKIKDATKETKDLGDEVKKAGNKAKHAAGLFGKFIKSIFRIALYRMIRSAIKAITEAFGEGLKNAYQYSKQSDTFTRLAETLDHLKSVTAQMVNQLGAFWGEFKQFIQPAVTWIIEKVRQISEYLTELFAALNGEKTYLQAQYVAQEWEEAADAVDKYKHQLLGLDELNNLSANKSNKKDQTDYSKLYKEVEVSAKMLAVGEKFQSFTQTIKDALSDTNLILLGEIGMLAIGAILLFTTTHKLMGLGLMISSGLLIGESVNWDWETLREDIKKAFKSYRKLITKVSVGLAAVGIIMLFIPTQRLKGIAMIIASGALMAANVAFNWTDLRADIKEAFKSYKKLITKVSVGLAAIGTILLFIPTQRLKGITMLIASGALLAANVTLNWDSLKTDVSDAFQKFDTLFAAIGVGSMVIGALLLFAGPQYLPWGLSLLIGGGFLTASTIAFNWDSILDGLQRAWDSVVVWWHQHVKGKINAAVNYIEEAFSYFHLDLNGDGKTGGLQTDFGDITAADLNVGKGAGKTRTKNVTGEGKSVYGGGATEYTTVSYLPGYEPGSSMRTKNVTGDGNAVYIRTPNVGDYTLVDPKAYKNTVSVKAAGGVSQPGSLFYAGERGPEFVGSIGKSSAIANTSQMTDAIYKAAYAGMSQALRENGGGNGLAGFVPATTDDLFIAMRKKASNYNKVTGNSAFA